MHRRAFLGFLSGLFVAVEPVAASAQAISTVRRIGYLAPGAPDTNSKVLL
jgi:hypothetical protein